jgi:hypothetical protein
MFWSDHTQKKQRRVDTQKERKRQRVHWIHLRGKWNLVSIVKTFLFITPAKQQTVSIRSIASMCIYLSFLIFSFHNCIIYDDHQELLLLLSSISLVLAHFSSRYECSLISFWVCWVNVWRTIQSAAYVCLLID